MFCTQCGKQTPDDQMFCEECGAPLKPQAKSAPVDKQAPLAPEVPVKEETFTLNTGDAKKPEKSKKPVKVPVIAAAAAAVLAVVLLIFNVGAIKNLWNRTVRSPEDYQKNVQKEEIYDNVTSKYGEFLESLDATSTTAGGAQVHLKVGDDILSLLEDGADMDMSWMSDIMLNVAAVQDGDLTQMDLGIGLQSTEIAAIRMIMDMTEGDYGTMYMGLPGLSDEYLEADLALAGVSAVSTQQFSAEDLKKILPDEKTFNDIVDRYTELVLSQINNVEKKAKTISCNGAEQKVTALTTTITAEELAEILISVFETMSQDEDIRTILDNAENALADAGLEVEDLYDGFRAGLDDAIEGMEDADVSEDDYITLVTYVDYSDNIVGRDLTITADDDDMEVFLYRSLTDGNKIGFNLEIPEADVVIEGEGTKKGDKVNAVYTLSVEGQDIGELELEDVVSTEDTLSGTYRIRPSSDLIEMALEDSGIPASFISDSIALVIEVGDSEKTSELAIRLVSGDAALVSLEFAAVDVESETVSVPADTIDVEDAAAMAEFLESLDFEALAEKMDQAGVPGELVDVVSNLPSLIEYYSYYY